MRKPSAIAVFAESRCIAGHVWACGAGALARQTFGLRNNSQRWALSVTSEHDLQNPFRNGPQGQRAVPFAGEGARATQILIYGFGGGGSRSQFLTHFTVLTSTSAFLWPEKVMSGRTSRVCVPLATLKLQLKLIFCTPRSLHPVWSRASVRLTVLS